MGSKRRARQRRERIVGHIAYSHEEAERWDLEFWQAQTPQARLSALVAIHKDIEKLAAARRRRKR